MGPLTVERLLGLLSDVRRRRRGWQSRCPAHEDREPSLSIAVGSDGRILLRCQAGCQTEDVVQALGLSMADLFPEARERQPRRRIVATYDYRAADGTLLFQVVRCEPKQFRQRRPNGRGGWIWNLDGVERVPYQLPELLAAPGDDVLVPEGEKDVDRLRALGFLATTNPGGAGKWRPEYSEALRGRRVFILADNDEPGRQHAEDVKGQLAGVAADSFIVHLPGLPPKGDVSDWLEAGGTAEELRQLLATPSETAAKATGTDPPIATLGETLTAAKELLCRFVHFGHPAEPVAITLWVALTYVWTQVETLVYLVLTSAVKQSGKTRTFDVLEWLVAGAWRVVRPSEAVTFRRIHRDHPTLLLDEYDTIFGDRSAQFEGIRAIFNSGNRSGTRVSRAVAKGRDFELVDFDIYCPKALAGIGPLPDTVADRAIVIHMSRRARGEPVERLRLRVVQALAAPIRDALAYHLGKVELADVEPAMPGELGDRAADGWEPLLAIADAAGGAWPDEARKAALALSANGAADEEDWGVRVLADVRTIFTDEGVPHLWTVPLIEALAAIEESPWGDIRGKPLSPTYLAKLLRPFGIGPKPIRDGTEVKRGYRAVDFEDAWARYLPSQQPPEERYARYSRYSEDQEAAEEKGRHPHPVAPVTPVTDFPGAEDRWRPPIEPRDPAAYEQMTWTG